MESLWIKKKYEKWVKDPTKAKEEFTDKRRHRKIIRYTAALHTVSDYAIALF
jgi:hypothetical protein